MLITVKLDAELQSSMLIIVKLDVEVRTDYCKVGFWIICLSPMSITFKLDVELRSPIDLHCINSSPMLITVKLITLGVELWSPVLITDHWKVEGWVIN